MKAICMSSVQECIRFYFAQSIYVKRCYRFLWLRRIRPLRNHSLIKYIRKVMKVDLDLTLGFTIYAFVLKYARGGQIMVTCVLYFSSTANINVSQN